MNKNTHVSVPVICFKEKHICILAARYLFRKQNSARSSVMFFTERTVHSDGVSCFFTEENVHSDGVSCVFTEKMFTLMVCHVFLQKKCSL